MIAFPALWEDLARGAALGLAVAAPIGPTALLCINSTLAGGRREGLLTSYGVSTIHMLYGALAAAGLAAFSEFAAAWNGVLQLLCGAFLMRVAIQTLRRRPDIGAVSAPAGRLPRAYATGLGWTLTNPITLIAFATLATGILGDGVRDRNPPLLAAGVLLGSAAWWTALTMVVGCARARLGPRGLRRANLATGMMLAGFAVLVLVRAGVAHSGPVTAWLMQLPQAAAPPPAPFRSAATTDPAPAPVPPP